MSNTSLQFQLPAKGAAFELVSAPKPSPEANEVSIRTKATALNPIDWKNQKFGVLVKTFPTVLGGDAAGVVEAVGENVKNFKVGDEVFTLGGMEARAGTFQEIITVPEHFIAAKPKTLSFEEAASIPVCYMSAVNGIVTGLKVALPFLDIPAIKTTTHDSILVLGGSSVVGAHAIQLLRLALPHAKILATSSAKHHAHLVSLGATKVFERTVEPSVIKAATPGGNGVDAILDTVGAAYGQPVIFEAFNQSGAKNYTHLSTGQEIAIPEGVTKTTIFGRSIFGLEGGKQVLPSAARLIEEGKYKLPLPVEVVGKGYDAITQGLNRMAAGGVSGSKLVVSM